MKWILGITAAVALGLASVSLASGETFDNKVDHEVGAAIALAYSNCIVEGGFDKSAGPSSRVAASGRTVLDFDAVVSQNIAGINTCTLPFVAQLTEACDCDDFDGVRVLYMNELARLNGWLSVGVVNVVIGPGTQETVMVGSSRYRFLTGE